MLKNRAKDLVLNSGRRIMAAALILGVCALATGCPHSKGYFAPTPARASHVATPVR
jgi:hypothetical protein